MEKFECKSQFEVKYGKKILRKQFFEVNNRYIVDIKTQCAYMTVLCPPLASVHNEGAAASTRSSSWVDQ